MIASDAAGLADSSWGAEFVINLPGYGPVMANLKKKVKEALTPPEPTKAELYAQATMLGIRGRSKMNKGALKAAVRRRQGQVVAPRL